MMWKEVEQMEKFNHRKGIVLYGTGLEGEKFFSRLKNNEEVVYCIDRRKRNEAFHGRQVFQLEEKEQELKDYLLVVAAATNAWQEIRAALLHRGLKEYSDFINAEAFWKKIAVVYGNCHMQGLCEYLQLNYFFKKEYYISFHYIGEYKCPDCAELEACDILITQDIRKDNGFHMPDADTLCGQVRKDAQKIVLPNLYGCNLFFPQCYAPSDNQVRRYLEADAIDSGTQDAMKAQRIRVTVESIGKRDSHIDECCRNGYSVEEIKEHILSGAVWEAEEIRRNFSEQLLQLKEREKKCDIVISDYIEKFYQQIQLFYEPYHPTEAVIAEKGRRILELLQLPQDEEIPMSKSMGAMEMPIYGCVKEALGLRFEQKVLRRACAATLKNQPESLEEYIQNYLVWVWGSGIL